jgi:hypothetical protein
MMIDGTFAGTTGASLSNVDRLLDAGYFVRMYFMHDKVNTSWRYTEARESLTRRGIGKQGFEFACKNVPRNVKAAVDRFGTNKRFKLSIVLQKELRDKDYTIVDNKEQIDEILNRGYNIIRYN